MYLKIAIVVLHGCSIFADDLLCCVHRTRILLISFFLSQSICVCVCVQEKSGGESFFSKLAAPTRAPDKAMLSPPPVAQHTSQSIGRL